MAKLQSLDEQGPQKARPPKSPPGEQSVQRMARQAEWEGVGRDSKNQISPRPRPPKKQ